MTKTAPFTTRPTRPRLVATFGYPLAAALLLAAAGCAREDGERSSRPAPAAVGESARAAEPGAAAVEPDAPASPKVEKPERKRRSPMFKSPGDSYAGPFEPLTDDERAVAQSLTADVERLAKTIGERNLDHFPKLVEAAAFIEAEFKQAGYQPARQSFDTRGRQCHNIEAELAGAARADEIVIIGAHYDTNPGTPGADDNASGMAAVLSLARRLAQDKPARTVRFVAFANEEAPYFQTPQMGSLVYAGRSKARGEKITAMLSLETIGFYSDKSGSQHYPFLVAMMYPSTGNFIGFVGNIDSQPLVVEATTSFRRHAKFPSEGAALPEAIDGVGWSDHWSFWQHGYPGVMVTDTANFRNPNYHQPSDTHDTLDYERTARVVVGLEAVVRDLAGQ